jgi:hypothetical protein
VLAASVLRAFRTYKTLPGPLVTVAAVSTDIFLVDAGGGAPCCIALRLREESASLAIASSLFDRTPEQRGCGCFRIESRTDTYS